MYYRKNHKENPWGEDGYSTVNLTGAEVLEYDQTSDQYAYAFDVKESNGRTIHLRTDENEKRADWAGKLKMAIEKARTTRDFTRCAEIQKKIDELKVCS